ncbi:MAG: YcjF family protein [Proteobacteria bacterium]|nr:YcjF family protein [Pseudomonadota bacterium]MBU1714991.1 YcjF family protein [Pseudomonadota bacterium]
MKLEDKMIVAQSDVSLNINEDSAEVLEKERREADNCIKNYVILAMGAGLLPSALVNVVVVTALEVKMIGSLAQVYEFPVPKKLMLYKILISLIGSLGSVYVSVNSRLAFKGVPLLGHAVYVGMMSVSGAAAMYAVGKIFQHHYESGGTFLSSDNSLLRAYFKEKYEEGKGRVPSFVNTK